MSLVEQVVLDRLTEIRDVLLRIEKNQLREQTRSESLRQSAKPSRSNNGW